MQAYKRRAGVRIKMATLILTVSSECQSSKSVKESLQSDFPFFSPRKWGWTRSRKIGMRAICVFKGSEEINVKKIAALTELSFNGNYLLHNFDCLLHLCTSRLLNFSWHKAAHTHTHTAEPRATRKQTKNHNTLARGQWQIVNKALCGRLVNKESEEKKLVSEKLRKYNNNGDINNLMAWI